MMIVSGALFVDASVRDEYIAGCRDVVAIARSAEGCIDFHLSADAIDPTRINVFEQWETVADVERFRGAGAPDHQTGLIRAARVFQHEIASTIRL